MPFRLRKESQKTQRTGGYLSLGQCSCGLIVFVGSSKSQGNRTREIKRGKCFKCKAIKAEIGLCAASYRGNKINRLVSPLIILISHAHKYYD